MPPQQALAFAAPGAEEMTKVVTGLAGGGITGVLEGIIIKAAPMMGAAAPMLSWGTLLGVPLVGVAGALFTRGIIGDLLQGVAQGGSAILGYTLPAMLAPELFGGKGRQTAEQRATLAASNVKLLKTGITDAPQRAQAAITSSVLEF